MATGFAVQSVLVVTGPLLARMLRARADAGTSRRLILWPLVITQLGEPGDPLGSHVLGRARSVDLEGARPTGPLLRHAPGAAPHRFPGALAPADPARGPCRGSDRRLAHPRPRAGDARPAVRPGPAPGTSAPSPLQRAASAPLGPLCDRRRRSLRGRRSRDRADRRGTPRGILGERKHGAHLRDPVLPWRRAPNRGTPVPGLLRAAGAPVQLLGRRRASPGPGGAGAVPLAVGSRPLRRRAGVHEPPLLHRQERRPDHLPVGRVAHGRRRMRAGPCGRSCG